MKILIVDDFAINLKLLRMQLETNDHSVLEAANGVEALQALERESVDAVISDILMPVMDGFQLCLEIRKSEKFRTLPFILYTSTYNSPADRQFAQTIGADGYLSKPAPTSTILDALRVAVGKIRSSARPANSRAEETYVLKQYSEVLVHKLEEKNTELQESERRLRDMLANMELVSLMLDREARITYCNDYLLRLTGWQHDEVLGRNWFELFIPPGCDELKELFAALLANAPDARHHESEILSRTGERRLIQWNNTLLRSAAGEVIGTASIGEDITERDRAEKLSRDLSRRLREAEETERSNINRELHDRIGPNLVALTLNFNLVQSQLPPDLLNTIGPRIDDAQKVLGATIAQLRNIMSDLRPAALDDYGLFAALRSYAQPYADRLGISVTVTGEDIDPRPSLAAETALFRITQEALNNIAKHARAQRVEITVNATADRILLAIVDDGVGFDAGSIRPESSSWGLKTMRERAHAIGAELRIESASGSGTRITVEMMREALEAP